MNLFIVESPGKIKKIKSILGKDFVVAASVGHIRDLPSREMGIEFNTWRIRYQLTDKGKGVFKNLKSLADKADKIYLATDLDREGEAIAWHLAVMLQIPKERLYRVKYNAITKDAITRALQNPSGLDDNYVRSQEARRAIDRLVGYTVSPALSKSTNEKLSAGRVQSVAVRLIVDRFNDHQAFVPVDHYGAVLKLNGFEADWDPSKYIVEGDNYNFDRELALKAANVGLVRVNDVKSMSAKKKPDAPFTTSKMQQAGVKKLGMNVEDVMKFAQELYEAAAITYHRTDSIELSPEAVTEIRAFASGRGLPIPVEPNTFSSGSKNAQEAHEAIRPTHIDQDKIDSVSDGAARLYELIYKQTLACQLAPAKIEKTMVMISSWDGHFDYVAKGSIIVDPGFMQYSGVTDDKTLPAMAKGDTFDVVEGVVKDLKTKPPALFNEASVVDELEKRGIGRPSTYAAILNNIKAREYIQAGKGKSLVPTSRGQLLRRSLDGFGFLEYGFTADIEKQMDEIASGNQSYQRCVTQVFDSVLIDMQKCFGYEGNGEDFFQPKEQRDYKASDKQIAVVKKVAQALNLNIDDLDISSGLSVSKFLDDHSEAYRLSFSPSEKQIAYAVSLADVLDIDLSEKVKNSAVLLSDFINKNRSKAQALKAPSDKQKEFAEKLSNEHGEQLPTDYATNALACSSFIDHVMKTHSKKRRSRKKKA